MRKITFDIETKNFFHDVGRNDPALLDIAIVCTHDSETDKYESFLEEDFPALWKLIEHADMLIGYNSDHFDIPLLNKYYPGDITQIKSLDIMKEIYEVLGRRLKLDNVAKATLNEGKNDDGALANQMWKDGEIERLKKYCIQDVKITKEVYDYAIQHGRLVYNDGPERKTVKLDTSQWETKGDHSMTHTLGF